VDNLSLEINFGKDEGISGQSFTRKLGIISIPIGSVGPDHLTALQTSLLLQKAALEYYYTLKARIARAQENIL
jgi:hypothetical protein